MGEVAGKMAQMTANYLANHDTITANFHDGFISSEFGIVLS
jgi:hypothetical protein